MVTLTHTEIKWIINLLGDRVNDLGRYIGEVDENSTCSRIACTQAEGLSVLNMKLQSVIRKGGKRIGVIK